MSDSETRSVVAIGDSRVIPAKAGISVLGRDDDGNGFQRGNDV